MSSRHLTLCTWSTRENVCEEPDGYAGFVKNFFSRLFCWTELDDEGKALEEFKEVAESGVSSF